MSSHKQIEKYKTGSAGAFFDPRVTGTAAQLSAPKQFGRWTSIAERLPPSSSDYLVRLRSSSCKVMSFAVDSNTFNPRGMHELVTHWMPLPPHPLHRK
jgi:Protein of unknown function (DUF551)